MPRPTRRGVPPGARAASRTRPGAFAIPYEYAGRFPLTGRAGNQVETAVSTSVDGVFVATAVGYGFEPARSTAAFEVEPAGNPLSNFFPWTDVTLGRIPATALIQGFRLSSEGRQVAYREVGSTPDGIVSLERNVTERVAPRYRRTMLEGADIDTDVSFLFSMLDTATGRELQDEPIHNLAGLGKSNGERPFRRLARPMVFQTRSTVRMQVVELGGSRAGELFVVLLGYKLVDLGGCSEEVVRAHLEVAGQPRAGSPPSSPGRVIPFDYVATVDLAGEPGRRVQAEVPINVDGGFVATSVGYALQIDRSTPGIRVDPAGGPVDLGDIPLDSFADRDILDGVRIRPNLVRLAFQGDGSLRTGVAPGFVPHLFERAVDPDDVAFTYEIFDSGTGRELQNRPILSLAGLGAADGDRPFKVLSRPLVLAQRSTIRVNVVEIRGRGRLQIVFQGYKRIASRRAG